MNLKTTISLAAFALSTSFVQAETLSIKSASDWGDSHASYPASNTIDGSLAWASRWAANAGGDAVNLVLDLGSVQTIDDVGISWGKGGDQTHSFEIWARASTSDSWTKVRTKGDSSGDTSSIESYNVDDMSARYVRIKTHSNSGSSNWTNIKEVEIYGTGSSSGGGDDSGGGDSSEGELTINTIFDDGTSHSSYPASKANDGSSAWSSRWAAEADGGAVNLTAEFDSSKDVTEVGVSWGRGDSREHTFEIYARNATSGSWTKVYDGVSSGESTAIETYNVTDITAKQVRLKVQSNSAGTDWANVTEMKIYGAGGSDSGGGDDGGGDDGGGDDGGSGSAIPSNITNGSIFDLEGDDPHPLVNSSTLEFVALEAKVTTPNGNGWRHEYKVESDQRIPMPDYYEYFKATIKVDLSDGGKTIVAQYHAEDVSTLMKLYIADSSESNIGDSNPGDGVFAVYVRMLDKDSGDEVKKALGTIKSGDSFTFESINNYGHVTVNALGQTLTTEVEDGGESYLKFGNYLQSQYPNGSEDCGESGDSDSFEECFDDIGITKAKITMTDVSYSRKVN